MRKILIIIFLIGIWNTSKAQDYSVSYSPLSLRKNVLEFGLFYKLNKNSISFSYGLPIEHNNRFLSKDLQIIRINYSYYLEPRIYTSIGFNSYLSKYKSYGVEYWSTNKSKISLEIGYYLCQYKRFSLKVYGGIEPSRQTGLIEVSSVHPNEDHYLVIDLNNVTLEKYNIIINNNTVINYLPTTIDLGYFLGFKFSYRLNNHL